MAVVAPPPHIRKHRYTYDTVYVIYILFHFLFDFLHFPNYILNENVSVVGLDTESTRKTRNVVSFNINFDFGKAKQ